MIPGNANPLLLATAAADGAAAGVATKSLRFNSADTANLYKSFDSSTSTTKSTISFWVKRGKIGSRNTCFSGFGSISGNYRFCQIEFQSDDTVLCGNNVGTTFATNQVFKDPSAWYHFVLAFDTTQATSSDRIRFYVNGSEVTSFSSTSYPSQNGDALIFGDTHNFIGANQSGGSATVPGDFYLADIHFIDGLGLDPTSFGAFDDNGVWQAAEYSGTFGTNGFHLDFSDATSTTTIAEDSSGNNNDWTANNISVTAGSGNDSMFDAPTNGSQSDTGAGGEVSGNYCTWNPLAKGSNMVLKNGNLEIGTTTGKSGVLGTIGMSSGKFYWETTITGSSDRTMVGIGKQGMDLEDAPGQGDALGWGYYADGGSKRNDGSSSSYGDSFTNGDVIGVKFDADNGTLEFLKNNTSQGVAFTGLTDGPYFPATGDGSSVNNANSATNWGQRAFTYTAPSNYKALCTTNLPTPTIADGSDYFDVGLWTGTGSSQTVSLGFDADFIWAKTRSHSVNHKLTDVVRGFSKILGSDTTSAEETQTTGITATSATGFTIGTSTDYNTSGRSYCAWAWDAGSSTASNTDGSITANVRANTSAGFSIIQFLGNATSGATVGHGLSSAPELVIGKNRGGGDAWWVWFKAISSNASEFLKLNTTGLKTSTQYIANNTAPSSTVITLGSDYGWNSSQSPGSILYAFTPVAGFSAFGEYTGASNLFIYTGFKPQWLMLKSYAGDGFNWVIIDDARGADSSNVSNKLYPNLAGAEDSDSRGNETKVVFLSNGFLFLDAGAETNSSARSYVYAAFASHPFKTSRGGFQNIP